MRDVFLHLQKYQKYLNLAVYTKGKVNYKVSKAMLCQVILHLDIGDHYYSVLKYRNRNIADSRPFQQPGSHQGRFPASDTYGIWTHIGDSLLIKSQTYLLLGHWETYWVEGNV